LFLAAVAYYILQTVIVAQHGHTSKLAKALGADWKGKLSPLLYAIAVVIAFHVPSISNALFILVALIWLVPDRRIERVVDEMK